MFSSRWAMLLALALSLSSSTALAQPTRERSERIFLSDAIQRALSRNPSVISIQADIRRAEALLVQARAGSLPSLSATGALTRLDSDRAQLGRVVAAQDQRSANVTLAVPLVVPQRWGTWSHASDDVRSAKIAAADVQRQVALATARAYLAVVAQHRLVDVTQRACHTARAHLDFSTARQTAGVGNRVDMIRAAQALASTEAQLATIQLGLSRTQEALGVLTGDDRAVDAAQVATFEGIPNYDDAQHAATSRSDVAAVRARLEASKNASDDNWLDYLPYLTGQIQPFYQDPPTAVQPETGWQAQLILTLPLVEGGLRVGQAKERAAKQALTRTTLEALLRQAHSEVRIAFEALTRTDQALQAARRASELASQTLELAALAYRAGATTNIEVIDAERRAQDAESAVAQAEDAARQARLDVLAASGRFP